MTRIRGIYTDLLFYIQKAAVRNYLFIV